ncbi:DUF2225 domain-containing protein [Cohnella cholangitidis]|uniref:DUF2225 domain-containing protein n=1 Tax=Cohnella cholangitidis TaxID=2598458 RepID=A0A7G5BVE5_9BACL|nr:DUF2225 domain-containing protein [Cohnella cholangitidis]QMV40929.1 DUF2225 domain-containing protein [Cohnella cholangitidis]
MEPLFQIKVKCICCDESFQTSRVRPSLKKAVKTDTDFCSYFKTVNPDFYVVRVCPFCGFATTEHFAERINDKQRSAYYEKLGSQWKYKDYGMERTASVAMECYKLSLITAQAIGEKDRVIAALLHHIAWLYRYEGKKEQEDRFIQFALDAYVRVYESERDSISNARLMYLIGELNKRLDNFKEAVRWFGRVIQDKKIVDAAMIRASREQWQHIREIMTGQGLELPEEMQQSGT